MVLLALAVLGAGLVLTGCDAYLSGALVHIQQNDYAGAIKVLNDGLAQQPSNGQYSALLAYCYSNTNQYKEAGVAYENAIKNWTEKKDSLTLARDDDWKRLLGRAQKGIQQMTKAPKESVSVYSENVVKNLGYAIDFAPNKADNYAVFGSFYGLTGKPAEAKQMFEKAISMDPKNTKLYLIIGRNAQEAGSIDEAIGFYKKYTELKSDDQEGFLQLGKAYLQKRTYTEAAEALKKATDIKKDDFLGFYLLGTAYLQAKKADEAVTAFISATTIMPNDKNGWYNLGQAYYDAKNYKKGAESFEKVVSIDPKDLEAWIFLGYLSDLNKDYKRAVDAYKNVVTLKPESSEYWGSLSQAYKKLGMKAEAEAAAKKAKELEKK
jgi:tetratricopeptide (TPR) repeat protein